MSEMAPEDIVPDNVVRICRKWTHYTPGSAEQKAKLSGRLPVGCTYCRAGLLLVSPPRRGR